MRYLSAIGFSLALTVASSVTVMAQGDSDPGMSTLGAMRNNPTLMIGSEDYENTRAHFGLGHTFAKGERDIVYNIPQVEVRVPLKGWVSDGYFDIKLPIHSSKGELWDAWGIGDLFVSYTHMFQGIQDWTIQTTLGTRLGLSTGDLNDGQTRSLPMSYQNSLGSTDAIVGLSATWKDYITIAAGYQQPVFRYNENGFQGSDPINDLSYSRDEYLVSSKLHRQGDVMLRLEGHYGGKRAGVSGGGLAFYHLANDLYTDRAGYVREVAGSDGLTVNVMGNAYVRFGRYGSYKIDVTCAVPIVERDAKPDGLGRAWVFMPRLTYFFANNNTAILF